MNRSKQGVERYLPGLLAIGLGLAAIVAGRAGDAPGAMLLGAALVIGTVAFYAKGTRPLLAVIVGLVGIAAGVSDDAPGVVLLGLLLLAAALAWSVRSARRQPA